MRGSRCRRTSWFPRCTEIAPQTRLGKLPGNRLEQFKANRSGQWSLRENDQFRICFRWTGSDSEDVEIVDYL